MTDTELTALISKISKQNNYQKGRWAKVIKIAREYAQMKLHGSYIGPNDCLVTVSFSDKSVQVINLNESLLRAIEEAFLEDALTGALLT